MTLSTAVAHPCTRREPRHPPPAPPPPGRFHSRHCRVLHGLARSLLKRAVAMRWQAVASSLTLSMAVSLSRHPSGPTAAHLCGQAAGGWPHAGRLQHPEGVDAAPGAPPPRRHHRAVAGVAGAQVQPGEDDLPQVRPLDLFHDSHLMLALCQDAGLLAMGMLWLTSKSSRHKAAAKPMANSTTCSLV